MTARALATLALGACAATGPLEAPGARTCGVTTSPGIAASALGVAATANGATVVWADGGGVMRVELGPDGAARSPAALAWPGAFDHAVATSVDGEVVVGAIAGGTTTLLGAPLGIGDLRELAVLGGIAGAPPIVDAGGQRLAPNVSYGGLLVASLDELWTAHTAQLSVLTPVASEVAAISAGGEAVIAWPAGDACFVALAFDAANGTSWAEPGACRSPRLAAAGGGVALAFERDDGVYLARAASPAALHPELAELVAPGASAPRLVAFEGTYWLSYQSQGGVVAGFVDASGALQSVDVAAGAAHELAVFGGVPHVLVVGDGELTAAALCAD